MANSVMEPKQATTNSDSTLTQQRIRGFVWKIAIATLLLMAVGSATRVMNAGLACPDWPLCYGELLPARQMNLQVFLEWFHRLDASLIGIMTIALALGSWWYRRHLPSWLPWAATGALGLIVFQGVLGGLTVTELLRFDIVTAHLGTALLFFITLLTIASALTPDEGTGVISPPIIGGLGGSKLPWVAVGSAILVYLQSISGGLVASQWALHQCFGYQQLCTVMHSHIIGVVFPTTAILTLAVMAWRTQNLHPTLSRLAIAATTLLVLQIALGVATFYLHLQVEPLTVAHHTTGAALLGTLVVFATLAMRD